MKEKEAPIARKAKYPFWLFWLYWLFGVKDVKLQLIGTRLIGICPRMLGAIF